MQASGDARGRRRAPLDMDPTTFREIGHELVDRLAEFLEALPEGPVNRSESPSDIQSLLPAALPERGTSPKELVSNAADLMFDHSLFNGHPRFLGYITSSAAPIGALADLLAAAVNPNLGGWQLSPVSTEIEKQTVRWIGELIGFPVGDGVLVSGGNMANFVGFLAARRRAGGAEIREDGLGREGRWLVYAGAETHTWIQKALDLFGHGTSALRTLPQDKDLRIDPRGLKAQVESDRARGHRPFLVVGNGGTVSTGAVDPLPELAEVCKELDLWFHVDGAYGAFAAALPEASPDLRGLSQADSVALDPHKWLYAPLEAGCVLVRDPDALLDAFSYVPSYYHFEEVDEPRVNFYAHGFQNSRGFRALKVWLGLRQAGREGAVEMIRDDIRLARELYQEVDRHPELDAVSHALSITTFRYVPSDLPGGHDREAYLNRLNETLLEELKESGEVFLSNAVVGGRFLLRSCVVNFRTDSGDMQAIPGIVARRGRAIHHKLNSSPA